MTDGIIQKVINELIEDIENAGYQAQQLEYDTISYQNEINMLNKLKQELIKRIKQFKIKAEHDYSELHEGDIDIAKAIEAEIELINKLIGDNQE